MVEHFPYFMWYNMFSHWVQINIISLVRYCDDFFIQLADKIWASQLKEHMVHSQFFYYSLTLQSIHKTGGTLPAWVKHMVHSVQCTLSARNNAWLTHWGRVTHICIGNLTTIGSDNGLSPGRRQAIIWTKAGILLIWPLGTNFSEILIGIQTFSFKKMHLKMSSAKCRPFCLGLNVLTLCCVMLWFGYGGYLLSCWWHPHRLIQFKSDPFAVFTSHALHLECKNSKRVR